MAGLAKLPTTAAGLRELVLADRDRRMARLPNQEPSLTEDVLDAALGVIGSPAPPKVRAAAYRMLAAQQGIRDIGVVRDGLGRRGVGLAVRVERPSRQGRMRAEEHLIIDPGSARILAREYYPIGAGGKVASEPSTYTLMIKDGWTDRIGGPTS
jgi:hypothetical protein